MKERKRHLLTTCSAPYLVKAPEAVPCFISLGGGEVSTQAMPAVQTSFAAVEGITLGNHGEIGGVSQQHPWEGAMNMVTWSLSHFPLHFQGALWSSLFRRLAAVDLAAEARGVAPVPVQVPLVGVEKKHGEP